MEIDTQLNFIVMYELLKIYTTLITVDGELFPSLCWVSINCRTGVEKRLFAHIILNIEKDIRIAYRKK